MLGSGLGSRREPHLDPLKEEEERRDLCWGGDTASGSCSEAAAMADAGCAELPAVAGDPLGSPGDPATAPGDGGSGGSSSAHRAASSSAVADSGMGGGLSTGGAKASC